MTENASYRVKIDENFHLLFVSLSWQFPFDIFVACKTNLPTGIVGHWLWAHGYLGAL